MNNYQLIIGLEIHVELKTNAKMFCQCPADYFGKPPNSQTCPVCLGLPGALPVPNKKAIEWTQLIGKALNCTINTVSKFDRKHYFYPDLSKGYQISQYDQPVATEGWLKLKIKSASARRRRDGSQITARRDAVCGATPYAGSQKSTPCVVEGSKVIEKTVRIRRVHIEEDTGKLIHKNNETLIDFNRSGVPLVEIVTEPDFESADDVKYFLEKLHTLIRYLDVSDCDMEKGSMRMEPNISLQIKNEKLKIKNKQLPPYKVEIKNINSFRFVKQAIEYEIKRQGEILEKGITPQQETRGFDERKNETYAQRTKEEAHDYRYFPEPDIPPMVFKKEDLEAIQQRIPLLPDDKIEIYLKKNIKYADAFILTREKNKSEKFDRFLEKIKKLSEPYNKISPQECANFFINKTKDSTPRTIESYIEQICSSIDLSIKIKEFAIKNSVIEKIINNNSQAVQDYKQGKHNSIMFLVGQVMKEMKGKADPQTVRRKLEEKIHKQ